MRRVVQRIGGMRRKKNGKSRTTLTKEEPCIEDAKEGAGLLIKLIKTQLWRGAVQIVRRMLARYKGEKPRVQDGKSSVKLTAKCKKAIPGFEKM